MKKILLSTILILCIFNVNAQKTDTIKATSHAWIVYDMKGKPLKVYQTSEDCTGYCFDHEKEGRKNQQINLFYGYKSDSVMWKPNRAAIQEDYLHPESLNDKYLSVDTIYIVMQEHFPIADRAYEKIRLADCYKYATNHELRVIKLPYLYRTKRSYEQIMAIKKKRLGIK